MKRIALAASALALAAGCGDGGKVQPADVEIKIQQTPLQQAQAVLNRYAAGTALGSEVTTFPAIVEAMKAVDAKKGEALEKGFADLQKSPPAQVAAKAKALLKRIE